MRRSVITALAGVALVVVAGQACMASVVVWTPAHEFVPYLQGSFLAWGDLDGDGDDDISVLAWWRQYWNVACSVPPVWQREDGAFAYEVVCMEQSGTLGDVDADGDLDLVYACWECCSFQMVWNTGTPQGPVFEYGGPVAGNPDAGWNARAWLCDIDSDGDLDLLAVRALRRVDLYTNTGTPQAPHWVHSGVVPGVAPNHTHVQLAMGDLDGDGDLDIVGATPFLPLQCWENVGTPQEWIYVENPAMLTGVTDPVDGAVGVALPDVDCDGDPDLVVTGRWDDYLYLNERITPVVPNSWGAVKALYR